MASSTAIFNHARYQMATGALDLSTGTFKAMLVTSTYSVDLDNHQFLSSVTNEASNYTRVTLAGVAVAKGTNKTTFKSNAIAFSVAGGTCTARKMIIYKDTGNAATSTLLCIVLMDDTAGGTDVSVSAGGTITVTQDATNGWVYI